MYMQYSCDLLISPFPPSFPPPSLPLLPPSFPPSLLSLLPSFLLPSSLPPPSSYPSLLPSSLPPPSLSPQIHTYKAPTWCQLCHHFLWGLKHQGMQCPDCGMDVHTQCVVVAMKHQCKPTKKMIKKGVYIVRTADCVLINPFTAEKSKTVSRIGDARIIAFQSIDLFMAPDRLCNQEQIMA